MLLDESDNPTGIDWYDLDDHGSYLDEELKIHDRYGQSMKWHDEHDATFSPCFISPRHAAEPRVQN